MLYIISSGYLDGNTKLSYVGGLSTAYVGAAAPCCGVMATGVVAVFVYTANTIVITIITTTNNNNIIIQ